METPEAKGINFIAYMTKGGDMEEAVQNYDYINCRIMGGAFRENGLQDQSELKAGEKLKLVLDDSNPHDAFAIAIYKGKKHLGYIPKELSSHIRRAEDYVCKVVEPYAPEVGSMNNWGARIRLIKASYLESCKKK